MYNAFKKKKLRALYGPLWPPIASSVRCKTTLKLNYVAGAGGRDPPAYKK